MSRLKYTGYRLKIQIILIFNAPFLTDIIGLYSKDAVIASFICPIMMIGMIPMMLGGGNNNKKSSCCEGKESNSSTQLELNKPTE